MPVPVVVVVLGHALQRASVTPALELEVVVAAPHSASVLEAVFERGAETGSGAAVGSAATVGVTAVGLGAAAGSGADREFESVPAEGELLLVGAVPGDSTMGWVQNCPALDKAAARTPSGAGVVGPVELVAETEAVLGVEAAIGIALPHKRHCDLDCVGRDAAVYTWHLGTRHIPSGRIRLGSTQRLATGRQADHNQGVAVREHATQGVGTQIAVVGTSDVVVHRLVKSSNISGLRRRERKDHYIHYDVRGSLPSSGQILCVL